MPAVSYHAVLEGSHDRLCANSDDEAPSLPRMIRGRRGHLGTYTTGVPNKPNEVDGVLETTFFSSSDAGPTTTNSGFGLAAGSCFPDSPGRLRWDDDVIPVSSVEPPLPPFAKNQSQSRPRQASCLVVTAARKCGLSLEQERAMLSSQLLPGDGLSLA